MPTSGISNQREHESTSHCTPSTAPDVFAITVLVVCPATVTDAALDPHTLVAVCSGACWPTPIWLPLCATADDRVSRRGLSKYCFERKLPSRPCAVQCHICYRHRLRHHQPSQSHRRANLFLVASLVVAAVARHVTLPSVNCVSLVTT